MDKLNKSDYGIRMKTSTDILRVMEFSMQELLEERIDNDRSRAITYACNTASGILKVHEMEKRLDELEEIVNRKG